MIFVFIIFGIVLFFFALYFVVTQAINNSELLKEIKVLLMESQNKDSNKRGY